MMTTASGILSPRLLTTRRQREVCVRVAVPDDAPGIMHVRSSAVDESIYTIVQSDELTQSEDRERETIARSATETGWLHLVAVHGEEIIAYLDFTNGSKRRTAHAGVFSVYVLDGWRGEGIGRALILMLLDWAENNPIIEKVTLWVFASNARARALYASCGFIEEGHCPRDLKYEDGTYDDSVLMCRFVDGA